VWAKATRSVLPKPFNSEWFVEMDWRGRTFAGNPIEAIGRAYYYTTRTKSDG
jgi:hypothetical protein